MTNLKKIDKVMVLIDFFNFTKNISLYTFTLCYYGLKMNNIF